MIVNTEENAEIVKELACTQDAERISHTLFIKEGENPYTGGAEVSCCCFGSDTKGLCSLIAQYFAC